MQAVTITQISPPELEALIENSVKRIFLERETQPSIEPDRWLNLQELCQYHPDRPSKATIYGWVNAGSIPVHKGGKKLRFLKSEIDTFLKQGRRKTLLEIEAEAKQYIVKRKGGKP
jgi:excisionase family DNA binding protein